MYYFVYLFIRFLSNHYSGVKLIVWAKYYPQVVHNDPYVHFLVIENHLFWPSYVVGGDLCPLTKPLTVLHYGAYSFSPFVWASHGYLWVSLIFV